MHMLSQLIVFLVIVSNSFALIDYRPVPFQQVYEDYPEDFTMIVDHFVPNDVWINGQVYTIKPDSTYVMIFDAALVMDLVSSRFDSESAFQQGFSKELVSCFKVDRESATLVDGQVITLDGFLTPLCQFEKNIVYPNAPHVYTFFYNINNYYLDLVDVWTSIQMQFTDNFDFELHPAYNYFTLTEHFSTMDTDVFICEPGHVHLDRGQNTFELDICDNLVQLRTYEYVHYVVLFDQSWSFPLDCFYIELDEQNFYNIVELPLIYDEDSTGAMDFKCGDSRPYTYHEVVIL